MKGNQPQNSIDQTATQSRNTSNSFDNAQKLNLTLIFNLTDKTHLSKFSYTKNSNLKKQPSSSMETKLRVPEAFRV